MNNRRNGRTRNSGVDGSTGASTIAAASSIAGGSTCAMSAIASVALHDRMVQSLHAGSFHFLDRGGSASFGAFSGKVESGFPSENATMQNAGAVSLSGLCETALGHANLN